ncbi:Alpha/Beta hydrolase protein [Aspergillus granulosus]|uniref:Alpha/Beta hydrolase protein n=1 Tax=Aspergillus granulosus TaxID=176169 RepID=A0ABR4HUL7_9EURO
MAPLKAGRVDIPMRDSLRLQAPPANPQTLELPVGHRRRLDCRALPSPIVLDQDQILTLRDGTKIRADIYRPRTDKQVPAIIMWGPYGKSGSGPLNINSMPLRAGIPAERLSGYENFEGTLDPAEWVPRGYAIINVDPRGVVIAPLEGLSDVFKEQAYRGGIPYSIFPEMISQTILGRQQQEDIVSYIKSTTASTDYIEDKRVDFSKVQVPAYIGASYSNEIHVVGSFRAFEDIPHGNKWIVIHVTQEWFDLYTDERTADLGKLFDYYLKGVKNDWPQTPPARLAILSCTKPAILNTPFNDLPWHTKSAAMNHLYLTPDLKLTLSIDISAPDHDDLDVYTHLHKADKNGNILTHVNIPPLVEKLSPEQNAQFTTNSFIRYWGPNGQLRASQRHVSKEKSGKTWATLSYEKVQPVKPGEVVRLEIQLWPTGLQFEVGEQLILKISGERIALPSLPNLVKGPNPNKGKHVLHLGGEFEARLDFFTIEV